MLVRAILCAPSSEDDESQRERIRRGMDALREIIGKPDSDRESIVRAVLASAL
jgi:hypothetical protein